MTGTVATSFSASFSPSPPRGMIRSTSPSWRRQLGQLLAAAAGDERQRARRQPGRLAASRGDRGEHRVRVRRRGRAAQHDRVAGLQAQRGGVDRHVRPRLVDDGDDAERHAHLAHVEPVGQAAAVDDLADRVGQRGDRRARRAAIAATRAGVERRRSISAAESPASRPASRSRALASRISRRARLERVGDREQRGVLGGGVERGERARGAPWRRGRDRLTDCGADGHGASLGDAAAADRRDYASTK